MEMSFTISELNSIIDQEISKYREDSVSIKKAMDKSIYENNEEKMRFNRHRIYYKDGQIAALELLKLRLKK